MHKTLVAETFMVYIDVRCWCRHDESLGRTFFQYDFFSYFKLL